MAGEQRERGGRRGGTGVVRLDVHRPIEGLIGLVLIFLPYLLSFSLEASVDFSTTALVVAGALGAPLATLGFIGSREGNPVAGRLHAALDIVFTVALVIAALVFAFRGESSSAIVFGAAALVYAVLNALTRYSGNPGNQQEKAVTDV